MNEKISIIVPVYNTQNYLAKCFDSIARQTYSNIEVIIVDDGSTDSSPEMCDEWGVKDDRFMIIHQTNQGQAAARNRGIDTASGKYIAFVDSDDYVSDNLIEDLYLAISQNNADISLCGYYEYHKNKTIVGGPMKNCVLNKEAALEELIKDKEIKSFPWGRLFDKKLFDGIRFPVGRNYEDLAINYRLFYKASIICAIDEQLYHYQIREGSMSFNDASDAGWHDKCHSNVISQIERTDFFKDNNEDKLAEISLAVSLPYIYSDIMTGYRTHNIKDATEAKKYLKKERKNIKNNSFISSKDKRLLNIYLSGSVTFSMFVKLKGLK